MADEGAPGPHNNYGNPPTGQMLREHLIASRTIANHNTPKAIFDTVSIDLLRAFSKDPSPQNINKLMTEQNSLDPEGVTGMDVGKTARDKGDLAGMMVARYGKVEDDEYTFNSDEVDMLRKWFENGGGQSLE